MPLYEYECPECRQRFDLLRPISKSCQNASCPLCHRSCDQIPSAYSYRQAITPAGKVRENMAEVEWKADRRIEKDPLLKPDNWLAKVKDERLEQKAFKNKVEGIFGKGPDSIHKYAAAVDNEKRRHSEDSWASD